MKRINFTRLALTTSVIGLALVPVSTTALQATAAASTSSANSARLQLIISRGNTEINRRLKTLNGLTSTISNAQNVSAADKASLTDGVTTEISSLTALKTKLDADTDVTTAASDAQGIITEYRVYLLVVPQVNLVRTADDQQVVEGKLSTLAGKLQTRVSAGTSTQQSELADMNSKISAAQSISSSVETNVLGLEPSTYTTGELSTYRNQLKTAQSDIQAATADAKSIIASLKS
jgi:hypothetical protein